MPENKKTLRAEIRRLLPPADQRPGLSAAVCVHLRDLPCWRNAGRAGIYLPLPDEVDVTPLAREALAGGRHLAIPALEPDGGWRWRHLDALDGVESAAQGPDHRRARTGSFVDPAGLDLVLVPARAVDGFGNRLGRGGGVYDRLLAATHAFRLAVVFDAQRVEVIPAEPHDQPMHAVASESGVRMFNPSP